MLLSFSFLKLSTAEVLRNSLRREKSWVFYSAYWNLGSVMTNDINVILKKLLDISLYLVP